MQVSAINNNLEFGKSHGRKAREAAVRRQEDAILALSDRDISVIANESAKLETNDKLHSRISTGLIAAIPVVCGLQAAVASRGMDGKAMAKELAEDAPKALTTKFFGTIGKNLKGAAARTAVGAASALSLAGLFAIIDGAVMAKREASKHSEGVRNFERKHPGTTLLGTITGALVAAHYIPKGLSALADKIPAKSVKAAFKNVTKMGENFNKNSVVNSMANGVERLVQNTPSSVKSVGKMGLALAPFALLVGALAHSFDHSAKRARVAAENARELKTLQMEILDNRCANNEKAKVAMAAKLNARRG